MSEGNQIFSISGSSNIQYIDPSSANKNRQGKKIYTKFCIYLFGIFEVYTMYLKYLNRLG